MCKVHWAEIRSSWTAWLGVSIGFIGANFVLILSSLALKAGIRCVIDEKLPIINSAAYIWNPAMNLVFGLVVGMMVIDASTSLVVDSRRGALARLALAGATPAQVVVSVGSQLALVSVFSCLVGAALAVAALPATLRFMAYERSDQVWLPIPKFDPDPLVILAAGGLAILAALVGGLRQARRASRIDPVEALRQSQADGERRMGVGRWLLVALCVLVLTGEWGAIGSIARMSGKETVSNFFQLSSAMLLLVGVLLAALAPILVGPLTHAWTALVPSKNAVWYLARRNCSVRGARLSKTVVPVMLTVGLLIGGLASGDILQSSLTANGFDIQLSAIGMATSFMWLGLPLFIALCGAVGSLVMMSRQRDAELALVGVVGATPSQRVLLPLLEAVIITVTGSLMGLTMVVASMGFLAAGLHAAGMVTAFPHNWFVAVAAIGVCLLVDIVGTVLPTLGALPRSEPQVVARLIAD